MINSAKVLPMTISRKTPRPFILNLKETAQMPRRMDHRGHWSRAQVCVSSFLQFCVERAILTVTLVLGLNHGFSALGHTALLPPWCVPPVS